MPVRTRNTNDEISLLREAAAGSAPAFLGLVQTYDRAVLNLALRATGSSEQAHRIYLDVSPARCES